MKLIGFQIKNYRSIIDSGIIRLSEFDNVSVLAGQNESGKSSILKALYDFERGEFEVDSRPFSLEERPAQCIGCTYRISEDDQFFKLLSENTIEAYKLEVPEGQNILDADRIKRIVEFTITRIGTQENTLTIIDDTSFKIFQSAILEAPKVITEIEESQEEIPENTRQKFIDITDDQNPKIAEIFKRTTPRIVFFEDFCDLLPDKILISTLKEGLTTTQGYRAVKNLEKILETDFVKKHSETDDIRGAKEEEENDKISISFQADWDQRIHGENKVIVKYKYEKRDGVGENGSYVNFYVETKKRQPLPPKQRSKGLIWFLSLWLELKAQDIAHNDLVLLLDEPDQHLHVKAQEDILKVIKKLADQGDQVIYATHSPYLIEVDYLSRIKLIINTENDGTRIEDIVTSKIDTEYKKDALQPIANAIGLHISGFSTLKFKNVIIEGVSDFYYFSAMKKVLNREGDYSFIPGIGVRQINNLISLCIGYGLSWLSVIDDDPKKGGKDSKKKFDEIKDFIFDGDESKTKEKVHILKGTVGIENMFILEDLKLVDPKINHRKDMIEAVGRKRKVIFSKMFFEKVNNAQITGSQISDTAKNNFKKVFEFIERSFAS